MNRAHCNVQLLACTPNALTLIYAAFRQCYYPGYVAELWEELIGPDADKAKQSAFVTRILASGHESPIEHVSFTFAIEGVSRALTHQLVRHRIASYSQQSQRYVDGSDFEYVLPPAIGRIPEAKAHFEAFMDQVGEAYRELKKILEDAGRKDKANEDARFVLPQAAASKIVVTMNCRSLLNFFQQRCCQRAQWEIRAMAEQMLELCRAELPVIFETGGAKCERLGYCPEGEKFTCGRFPTRSTALQT